MNYDFLKPELTQNEIDRTFSEEQKEYLERFEKNETHLGYVKKLVLLAKSQGKLATIQNIGKGNLHNLLMDPNHMFAIAIGDIKLEQLGLPMESYLDIITGKKTPEEYKRESKFYTVPSFQENLNNPFDRLHRSYDSVVKKALDTGNFHLLENVWTSGLAGKYETVRLHDTTFYNDTNWGGIGYLSAYYKKLSIIQKLVETGYDFSKDAKFQENKSSFHPDVLSEITSAQETLSDVLSPKSGSHDNGLILKKLSKPGLQLTTDEMNLLIIFRLSYREISPENYKIIGKLAGKEDQAEMNDRLCEAVKIKNKPMVEALLELGADPKAKVPEHANKSALELDPQIFTTVRNPSITNESSKNR